MNKKAMEAFKRLQESKGVFDELLNEAQKSLSNLPIEDRRKFDFFDEDIETIKNSVKKGDMSEVHKILRKYAG